MGPAIPPTPDRSQSPVIIYAKELDASKTREGEARGNVELFRMDQHFRTEQVLFDPVKEIVTVVRNLRSEMGVPPGKRGKVILRIQAADQLDQLAGIAPMITLLAKLEEVEVKTGEEEEVRSSLLLP